jgi:hypothetical protein
VQVINDNPHPKNSVLVEVAIPYQKAWLKANPRIFSEVARQLSKKKRVSKQFVREVFYGRRRSARVERAFRRLRAPGFESVKKVAA